MLDLYGEALTRKCILRALEGDVRAMRLCMERISPARRDSYVRMKLPSIRTVKDVEQANQQVIRGVATGKITPADAQILSEILDKTRRVIETAELQARIEKLERSAGVRKAA